MSAAPIGIGLIFSVLLLLLVVGLICGVILWATSGNSRASREMSCGGCGYAVRGLSELNCPECGADLREVGINRGGSQGKRIAGLVLTLGCGPLLLLGCVLSGVVFFRASAPSHGPPAIQAYPNPTPQSQSPLPAAPSDATLPDDSPGPAEDTPTDDPSDATPQKPGSPQSR